MKNPQRTYIPGSEWLYLKIYTGSTTSDKILVNEVSRVIAKLEADKLIVKWFFIRYADPDFHLRVRLKVKECAMAGQALLLFHSYLGKLIEANLIWKVQVDTYTRELERYKENLIDLTEDLFCVDSRHTIKVLRVLNLIPNENARVIFAIKMIDSLLDDFGYDDDKRLELFNHLDRAYKSEFGYIEGNSKQFNALYRNFSKEMYSYIVDGEKNPTYLKLDKILSTRSKQMAPIVMAMGPITTEYDQDSLMSSYIHMMVNRIFKSNGRLHELIIYDFLCRLYISKIARKRL